MEDDGSWEARRKRALDVYGTLRGGEPSGIASVANGIESVMGAIGSLSIDHVLGDIWCRPGLARRDRSVVSVTALTCLGSEVELRTHVNGALQHGVTGDELEEMMLHIAGYAGFPRAIEGARCVLSVFQERGDVERPYPRPTAERKSDARRRADGSEVFERLTGGGVPHEQAADIMEARIGPLGRFGIDTLFGEIWARPELSRRDRSLVTLVALIVTARFVELQIHVRGALHHGLTRVEIDEGVLQLSVYVGYPIAVEAYRVIRDIYAEIDAANAKRDS